MDFRSVFDIVRSIPKGKVATYGQVALLAGNPRWAHAVGFALSRCHDSSVPCHRVVNRMGYLSDAFDPIAGREAQRMLLQAEGVEFLPDGRVDMERFVWS